MIETEKFSQQILTKLNRKIEFSQKEFIDPWLTYITLAVISIVFVTDILIKNIVLKAGRHKLKQIQKENLDNLLNSSISSVKKMSFLEIKKSFMSNSLAG